MGLELLTSFIVAIKFTEEVSGRVYGEMMRTQGLRNIRAADDEKTVLLL
jgi:hypothetical protein